VPDGSWALTCLAAAVRGHTQHLALTRTGLVAHEPLAEIVQPREHFRRFGVHTFIAFGDAGVAVRLDLEETTAVELRDRLTDWCARDSEPLDELVVLEALTWLEGAVNDGGEHLVEDDIAEESTRAGSFFSFRDQHAFENRRDVSDISAS